MIVTASEVLAGFEGLSPVEKQKVASEILRRCAGEGDIPDAGFDEIAAELFRAYDAEESADAPS